MKIFFFNSLGMERDIDSPLFSKKKKRTLHQDDDSSVFVKLAMDRS